MKRVYMKNLLIDEADAQRAAEICVLYDSMITEKDGDTRVAMQAMVNAKAYSLAATIDNMWRHKDD